MNKLKWLLIESVSLLLLVYALGELFWRLSTHVPVDWSLVLAACAAPFLWLYSNHKVLAAERAEAVVFSQSLRSKRSLLPEG